MKRQMCSAIIAFAALAAAACGGRAPLASNGDGGGGIVRGAAVETWIESGGARLEVFEAEGRPYVLGEEGAAYAIVVANRSDGRVEVVISVDGRDAVSGREADYRANRGYVLDPGEETRVEGFRTSLERVAAFEFAAADESYAARMGTPANVGVIGLAVFDEAPRPPEEPTPKLAEPQPVPYAADEAAAPSSTSALVGAGGEAEARQGLGTKYGRDVGSGAVIVPFARRDSGNPIEVLAVYYDDRAGLEGRGIVLPPPGEPEPDPCAGPNPFPGVPCAEGGFAPPPP